MLIRTNPQALLISRCFFSLLSLTHCTPEKPADVNSAENGAESDPLVESNDDPTRESTGPSSGGNNSGTTGGDSDGAMMPTTGGPTQIYGSVSSLAIASGDMDNFQVSVLAIDSQGQPGALVATASLDAAGDFVAELPPGSLALEIAVQPKAAGLVAPQSVVRSRVLASALPQKLAVNDLTEMATLRSLERLDSGDNLTDSIQKGQTEVAILSGVKSVQVAPLTLDELTAETVNDAGYHLFIKGLAEKKEALGLTGQEMLALLTDDFRDGSMDGFAANKKVFVGVRPSFPMGFDQEMILAMKGVIKEAPESAIDLNAIPKVVPTAASAVDMLSAEQLVDYEPERNEYFLHWIEFKLGDAVTGRFSTLDDCIGPIKIQRVNRFGRSANDGPAIPVQLGAISNGLGPQYFTASDCSGVAVTSTVVPEGQSESVSYYVKPRSWWAFTLMIYANSIDLDKVSPDFSYFPPETAGGLPIANYFELYFVDSVANFPASFEYLGGYMTEIPRETCVPGILEFSGRERGAVFVSDLVLNSVQGYNDPGSQSNGVTLHSDSDCQSANLSTLTIPQGQSYSVFYLWVPNGMSRFFTPNNGFKIVYVAQFDMFQTWQSPWFLAEVP